MVTQPQASNPQVYTDLAGLDSISQTGRRNTAEGMRQVAEQFEAMFLNMMMKSMRKSSEALFEDNPMRSNELKMHQQNFHNQLSMNLSEAGGVGLADTLYQQMMQRYSVDGTQAPDGGGAALDPAPESAPAPAGDRGTPDQARSDFASPEEFVSRLRPAAESAAQRLGVESDVLLAQAALETGWGRKIPQAEDGSSSHNLFGIKADSGWSGDRVTVGTLEYRDGVAQRENASFRSYDSWEESFSDYVGFLNDNPRYAPALNSGGDADAFLSQLQQSGYATDPVYADKIRGVMQNLAMVD